MTDPTWDDAIDVDCIIFGERTCTQCGRTLPANTEHFHRDQTREYGGLRAWCVECVAEKEKARRRVRS